MYIKCDNFSYVFKFSYKPIVCEIDPQLGQGVFDIHVLWNQSQ